MTSTANPPRVYLRSAPDPTPAPDPNRRPDAAPEPGTARCEFTGKLHRVRGRRPWLGYDDRHR